MKFCSPFVHNLGAKSFVCDSLKILIKKKISINQQLEQLKTVNHLQHQWTYYFVERFRYETICLPIEKIFNKASPY